MEDLGGPDDSQEVREVRGLALLGAAPHALEVVLLFQVGQDDGGQTVTCAPDHARRGNTRPGRRRTIRRGIPRGALRRKPLSEEGGPPGADHLPLSAPELGTFQDELPHPSQP